MEIRLYKNTAENNRVIKTAMLTGQISVSGTFNADASVTTPAVTINTQQNISGYNYCYIEEFGRYYYITEIKSSRVGIWEVTLSCDVLQTYAAGIMACSGIVRRKENGVAKMLPDDNIHIQADKNIDVQYFPNPFDKNFAYILTVAGGGA